jgi:hypothetical protein
MNEEKKDENVESLLEKSLELATPPLPPPTPLPPRRKYQRRNKHNIPDITPERRGDNVPVGFPNWAHERQCASCSAVVRVAMSSYPHGSSSADWEVRNAAVLSGWEVRLHLSGYLQYTCPRCLLKAA